jgi:hypothetical protein
VLQTNGHDTVHFVTTTRLLISLNRAKAATCEYKALTKFQKNKLDYLMFASFQSKITLKIAVILDS